jgi:hypothetical protein
MRNSLTTRLSIQSFANSRLFVAVAVGFCAALATLVVRLVSEDRIADLYFPVCAARALWQGIDPYGGSCDIVWQGRAYPTNPLTTVLVTFPFAALPHLGVSVLMTSLASGLLAYGLSRDGQWWRLLAFAGAPYWVYVRWAQWGILLAAIAVLPQLLPLTLVKPHIGLAVALPRLTLRRVIGCLLFGLASLLLLPDWPLRWLVNGEITYYDGVIPLLVWPLGLTLVVAWLVVWRYRRDASAWTVALLTIVPQRSLYDFVVLWTLLRTRQQAIILTLSSWLIYGLYEPRVLSLGLYEARFIAKEAALIALLLSAALLLAQSSQAHTTQLPAESSNP